MYPLPHALTHDQIAVLCEHIWPSASASEVKMWRSGGEHDKTHLVAVAVGVDDAEVEIEVRSNHLLKEVDCVAAECRQVERGRAKHFRLRARANETQTKREISTRTGERNRARRLAWPMMETDMVKTGSLPCVSRSTTLRPVMAVQHKGKRNKTRMPPSRAYRSC
mgnify:CR=1 FL=1